jgi:cryptochrome
VQQSVGCIIGQDYPMPILDDVLEKERCMARLKVAYSFGFYGSDEAVLKGTADGMLKDGYRQVLSGINSDTGSLRKQGQKRKNVSGGDGSLSNLAMGVKTQATKKVKHGSGNIESFFTKKRKTN